MKITKETQQKILTLLPHCLYKSLMVYTSYKLSYSKTIYVYYEDNIYLL